MTRSADYTILGFIYQFHKTLLEILDSSDDSIITVEGIIEDVEIETPSNLIAIQCKYHEASESFNISDVFKPLLQMMHHFYLHPDVNIQYILFAYFPGKSEILENKISISDLQAALETTNKDLQGYVLELHNKIDLESFFLHFKMEFGPSYEEIINQVQLKLKGNGVPETDIEILAYPNAINMIANTSVKHNPIERRITKRQFLESLNAIHKTAISRWTLAMNSHKKILQSRRQQLKGHLDKNTRLRYFLINSNSLNDFDSEIVLFISDYLEKYHFKPAHISTPVFCISTTMDSFRDIQFRLHIKGIISTDGYIGEHFESDWFFRDPLKCKGPGTAFLREFSIRLLRWEDHGEILNNQKCDDLYILGRCDCATLDTTDVNNEVLETSSLKEIKYLIGVSNVYE
jgi:hypothetical protein